MILPRAAADTDSLDTVRIVRHLGTLRCSPHNILYIQIG